MNSNGIQRTRIILKQLREAVCATSSRIIYHAPSVDRLYIVVAGLGGDYDGGEYLFGVEFPDDYPFTVPRITAHTPTGAFKVGGIECELGSRITVSAISDAIVSGMLDWESAPLSESRVISTCKEKRRLAGLSQEYNMANYRDTMLEIYKSYVAGAAAKDPDLLRLAELRLSGQ